MEFSRLFHTGDPGPLCDLVESTLQSMSGSDFSPSSSGGFSEASFKALFIQALRAQLPAGQKICLKSEVPVRASSFVSKNILLEGTSPTTTTSSHHHGRDPVVAHLDLAIWSGQRLVIVEFKYARFQYLYWTRTATAVVPSVVTAPSGPDAGGLRRRGAMDTVCEQFRSPQTTTTTQINCTTVEWMQFGGTKITVAQAVEDALQQAVRYGNFFTATYPSVTCVAVVGYGNRVAMNAKHL